MAANARRDLTGAIGTDDKMNSRERVRRALAHQQPDRVPLDLGGTGLTTIHLAAYQNLRQHLGLPTLQVEPMAIAPQLAVVDEDLAERLATDVRPVAPGSPSGFEVRFREEGAYEAFTDEWGIGWRRPLQDGFYFDMVVHPLSGAQSLADLRAYALPNPLDDGRFATLRAQAQAAVDRGKAVVLGGPADGIAEVYSFLRGYEQYYIDLATNHSFVEYMLDRLVEFECAYWERALREVGDLVDVVIEGDDLAGQQGLLLSPRTYRRLIKPRHRRLCEFIKAQAPVKVFFHSCGAVRPLIGDLIDAGIDILNPVQIAAAGMDPQQLKQEFGRDLVFWGGGVDTQQVLGVGTPAEVRAHVRRNIAALAPGGGFVFAAVHNIQADVPAENIMAMWETWREAGVY